MRAIAVGLVLGYHFFPNHVRAGFVGVDIFFVISGYLISSIIMGNIDRGYWKYSNFYVRRINRIFPALIIILAVNLILAWYALLPNEFISLGKHVAASAGFVENFTLWGEAGYFDNAADTKPLLHLWSLAIEEQFYIVWPIILVLSLRKRFAWICTALIVGSLAYSCYTAFYSPTEAYYSPLSRFFELAVGGAIAFLHRQGFAIDKGRANILGAAGVMALILGLGLIDSASPFPGYYAMLPTFATGAFIAAGPVSFVSRYFLSLRPLVWVGLISYPLYLWHWTLLVWAKILTLSSSLSVTHRIGLIGLSFLLAWLTFVWAERPVRKRNTSATAVALGGAMAVIAIVGLLFWSGRVPNRLALPELEKVVQAVNDWDYPPKGMVVQSRFSDYYFYRKPGGATDAVLFVGDSNAEQYAPRANRLIDTNPGGLGVVFATKGSCPFASPELARNKRDCANKLGEIARLVKSDDIRAVVIAQQWTSMKSMLSDRSAARSFETWLASIPASKKKYVILSIPSGEGFAPNDLLSGSRLGELRYRPTEFRDATRQRRELSALNALIRKIAERQGAVVIDPFDTLCRQNLCRITYGAGRPVYKDREHLAASFVRDHVIFIDQIFERDSHALGYQASDANHMGR
jgi:peptidoglycan/LPS O-acetylase OafA/YrhL